MILAITGHRPPKVGGYQIPNPVYEAVYQALDEGIMRLSPDHVIVGMSLGVDQWAAEICIRDGVPFTAAIPFDGYDVKWPPEARAHYRSLLNKAQTTMVITPGAPYHPSLLQVRNSWMCSRADALLAVWNGMPSGTSNCVRAARHYRKQVHMVDVPQNIWDEARAIELRNEGRTVGFQVGGHVEVTYLTSEGEVTVPAEALQAEVETEEERVRNAQHLEDLNRTGRQGRRRRNREVASEADVQAEPAANIMSDMAQIREALDRQIAEEAARLPDSVSPERVLRQEVVRERSKNAPEKVNEDLTPKRVIEIGED